MFETIINFFKRDSFLFTFLCFTLILNHRMGYVTLIGLFSILMFIRITSYKKIDKGGFIILLFIFFYIPFSFFNGFTYDSSTLILYAIAPYFFYQYGEVLVKSYNNTENELLVVWLLIIFSYCGDTIYLIISEIISSGQLISFERNLEFGEDGNYAINATSLGLSLDIGMVGLTMFLLIKNRLLRISYFILFFLSLIATFHLLNRTGLFIAILCFAFVIGYKSRKDIKILIYSIIFIFIIYKLLIFTGIINEDLLDFYESRNKDLSTMGSRTTRWKDAIFRPIIQPFGWASNGEVYYIHNMWLDVARISGIIPFLFLVYFAFDCFIKSFKLIKYFNNSLSYLMLGLNICFGASCFVEPIYGGTHLLLYFMLWGTENALIKQMQYIKRKSICYVEKKTYSD